MSVSYGDNFNYYSDFSQNNVSKHLKDIAHHIAQQLNKSKNNEYIKTKTLAILSIVDIENLKKTSDLGKRISENLIYEMQTAGYKVLDYKATNSITIDNNGEYLFSRAIKDLKKQRRVTYALSGTYTRYRDSLSINCRIIDITTSIVVATANLSIPKSILRKIDKKQSNNNWYDEVTRY
jgi:TolB-like protein